MAEPLPPQQRSLPDSESRPWPTQADGSPAVRGRAEPPSLPAQSRSRAAVRPRRPLIADMFAHSNGRFRGLLWAGHDSALVNTNRGRTMMDALPNPPGPPMSFGSIFVMHAGVVFVRSESIPTFTQVSLDERGRSYFKLTPVTPGLTSRFARWRRRRPDAASGSRHRRRPPAGAERSNARPDRHRSASPISGCQRGCRSSSRPRPGREVRHQYGVGVGVGVA